MAAPFAIPTDVALRLGTTFTTEETAQVTALLDDVSEEIRARRPLIDTWIVAGSVTAGIVKKVACEVVMAFLNGGGIGVRRRAHPELADEYTDAAANGLSLSDEQLDRITPDSVKTKRGKAFSITPG